MEKNKSKQKTHNNNKQMKPTDEDICTFSVFSQLGLVRFSFKVRVTTPLAGIVHGTNILSSKDSNVLSYGDSKFCCMSESGCLDNNVNRKPMPG